MRISKNYRIIEKDLSVYYVFEVYVIAKDFKIETSQTVQKCVSNIRQTPRFAIFYNNASFRYKNCHGRVLFRAGHKILP